VISSSTKHIEGCSLAYVVCTRQAWREEDRDILYIPGRRTQSSFHVRQKERLLRRHFPGGSEPSIDWIPSLVLLTSTNTKTSTCSFYLATNVRKRAYHLSTNYPDIRSKLDPEYVAFHDKYMQYVRPDEIKPWDGSARKLLSLLLEVRNR